MYIISIHSPETIHTYVGSRMLHMLMTAAALLSISSVALDIYAAYTCRYIPYLSPFHSTLKKREKQAPF